MSGETVEWGAEVAPGDIRLVPPEWVSEAKRPRSQGVPLPLYKRRVVRTEWEPAEVAAMLRDGEQ